MDGNQICPYCSASVSTENYFCPNCGRKLRDKPLSTSVSRQIGIYVLSIFLPPLGLWPGIKYVMQAYQKAKIVGAIAIALTLISTVVTIWATFNLLNSINKAVNQQLGPLSNSMF